MGNHRSSPDFNCEDCLGNIDFYPVSGKIQTKFGKRMPNHVKIIAYNLGDISKNYTLLCRDISKSDTFLLAKSRYRECFVCENDIYFEAQYYTSREIFQIYG